MPSSEPGPLYWSFLGSLPYGEADELQRRLRERVRQTPGGGYLLLLEHPHVFTLGRNANPGDILVDEEWLSSKETAVFASDRGGRVTYHGPGQLVGYPILDLSPDRRDLRRYVRDLQEVLVRALGDLGIAAEPRHQTEEIGVWVEDRKIASIGVHVSRWITTHGFALNIATDLSYFAGIIPCGLQGVEMTSVEALTGRRPTLAETGERVAEHFCSVFDRQPLHIDSSRILDPWPITL
jgi:lipoate-protein ligase B